MSADPVRRANLAAIACDSVHSCLRASGGAAPGLGRCSARPAPALAFTSYRPARLSAHTTMKIRKRSGSWSSRARQRCGIPVARTSSNRGTSSSSRWPRRSAPRPKQQRVNRPRRDVLLDHRGGCRRLPGQRHDPDLHHRRNGDIVVKRNSGVDVAAPWATGQGKAETKTQRWPCSRSRRGRRQRAEPTKDQSQANRLRGGSLARLRQ